MTTSIFSESWCGIVFDGRNQHYGAYELRKSTERNMLLAILFSVSLLSIGINVMLLKGDPNKNFIPLVDDEESEEDEARVLTEVDLLPPPADESEPEPSVTPPQPEPTPPSTATIDFTNIEIVDDNTAHIDTVTAQQNFGNAEAGATTQPGDSTLTASAAGTEGSGNSSSSLGSTIRDFVEDMPQYPGGEDALRTFLAANTKYPDMGVENELEATVYVLFVVDRDGSLTDVHVARKNYKCLDDEAVRVVQSMPKWKPGRQNGELARVRYVVPIKFELGSN